MDTIREDEVARGDQLSTENGDMQIAFKRRTPTMSVHLSVDKFIVNGPSTATTNKYFAEVSRSAFSPNAANQKYPLGTYADIESRSKFCPFCSLVAQSVSNDAKTAEQQRAICYLSWEIDGRSVGGDDAVRARTRRIHLQWQDGLLEDAYLVLVTPNQYSLINSNARNLWQTDAHFLARIIPPDASRATLIKSWLDECLRSHNRDCVHSQTERKAFKAVTEQSFFGVVDVEQMCLTSLPRRRKSRSARRNRPEMDNHVPRILLVSRRAEEEHDDGWFQEEDEREPYVALSYVWGNKNVETTVNDNVLMRLFPGGLEEPLKRMPKVIRDAIDVVRRLGYRYIWIDSLCIVQDSRRSWKLNAEVMDTIYGNADLTICAADGVDSTSGLRAWTMPATSQIIEECAPGVKLMVSRLAEAGIRKSKWNTRAWTFQERLLSRRCLIFTEGRLIFQCRSATMSEDIVTSPESTSSSSGWSLDLVQSPLKLLESLTWRPIWFYMNCVPLYSSRDLTKPGDILAAFNGVSNNIENALNATMVFGLPSSHFDLALLWSPLGESERRHGEDDQDFPSWSWCGWKGTTMDYLTNSMVDDCVDDINDWLTTHTWIQWYVRDGRGRLRPLWDSSLAPDDRCSQTRWRGYAAGAKFDGTGIPTSGHTVSTYLNDGELPPRHFDPWRHHGPDIKAYNDTPGSFFKIPDDNAESKTYVYHANSLSHTGSKLSEVLPSNNPYRQTTQRTLSNNMALLGPTNSPVFQHERHATRGSNAPLSSPDLSYDSYGRRYYSVDAPPQKPRFSRTIPESPYRVNLTNYAPHPDKEYPDSPILQFWTFSAVFRVYPTGHSFHNNGTTSIPETGLRRFNIADASNDWCGSILLSHMWARKEEERLEGGWGEGRYEFLALSRAKRFTDEECREWTYYMPVERRQSEWNLYFVLLVEKRNGIWYRVALGKVFATAFENGLGCPSQWKEIVLG